jgi:hypothetical protein
MSNLEFELWWAGGRTTLLTIQPQVGSPDNASLVLKAVQRKEKVSPNTST